MHARAKSAMHAQDMYLLVDEVGGQVQIGERELDGGVNLAPRLRGVLEALEVQNEDLRSGPEVQLLGGLHVLLALGTVPGLRAVQPLLLHKGLRGMAKSSDPNWHPSHLGHSRMNIMIRITSTQ